MFRGFADQRGMTLAEVLIAVAIIAIGLLALLGAVPLAGYAVQEGNQLSTSTFLANQRLEQVKNAQWTMCPAVDQLGLSPTPTTAPQTGAAVMFPDESPMAAPYAAYTRRVRISGGASTACPPGGIFPTAAPATRQVTVTVSYQPLTGVGQAAAGTTKSAIVTMTRTQR